MNLTTPLYNCEKTTIRLIHNQKIDITDTTIRTSLETHPDYPSLLCISDFLHNHNIENIALKTRVENFSTFPLPFIAHIALPRTGEKGFTLVHGVKNNTIIYEDVAKNKLVEEDINHFKQRFAGHVLLVDSTEAKAEKDYVEKRQKEKLKTAVNTAAAFLLPGIVLWYIITLFVTRSFNTVIFQALFLILSLIGVAISFLLLLFEIDSHNPLIKEICQGGKKINCQAVLQSKVAGIMGVSWSSIGFCYFWGMLLSQILSGVNNLFVMTMLSFLNLLALPYIFFSLYYQWKVVKQWCILCLAVQAIIALQCLISVTGGLYSFSFAALPALTYLQVTVCFLLPSLVIYVSIPALKKAKEGKEYYNSLQRFKSNPEVFDAILSKQKRIQHSPDGLGITLGNPNANCRIIKVCNPYCGPCAKAHPIIEELIEQNDDIQLQVIFTASGEDTDFKTPPVRHFLTIASKNDESLTKKMLDDWYNTPVKDYTAFAKKYPVEDGNLLKQDEKIRAMNTWCETQEVSFTPTFFVNGFQLPESYRLPDLKFIFNPKKVYRHEHFTAN